MNDNLDGLNPKQARVLRAMIARSIRQRCLCSTLKLTCVRCRQIAEIREHFPQNWAYAADIHAQTGPLQ